MTLPTKPLAAAAEPSAPQAPAPKLRAFGRFGLRQLLGKSERSMVWLAHDPRVNQDVMLTLPRVQPADAAALEEWQREVNMAARLKHPQLAAPSEIGVQDQWPYTVVDRAYGLTLGEWLTTHAGAPVLDQVSLFCELLEGLAFAHDAGSSHGDLQLFSFLVSDQGNVRLMGLSACGEPQAAPGKLPEASAGAPPRPSHDNLRLRRAQAERDVLSVGLLLYRVLSGQNPLDQIDVAQVIDRLPPLGREIVRLPWGTPRPVPDALRAIVNRATSSQERQRYLNARTLLRALTGWRDVEGHESNGPLALLLDRLRSVGHLPAMPGVGRRVSQIAAAVGKRTDELAEQILQDMALSLELLRLVNSSLMQASQGAGAPAVITVRRAVALLGVDGVRRASTSLRTWPGPLSPEGAANLQRMIDRVRLAGHTAQALRPPGYDAEVVFLVVLLQNLGRLLVQYHFPEEAEQIVQLMHSAAPPPGSEPGTRDLPGLSESAASLAVLGVDMDTLGAAVARHWGLGEEVQLMMRRVARDKPVRLADGDSDLLRTVASAANEVVDAVLLQAPAKLGAAIVAIAQRYGRALSVDAMGLRDALQSGRQMLRGSGGDRGTGGGSKSTSPSTVAHQGER